VYYGGLAATRDDDRRLRAVEEAVRGKPLSHLTSGAG
jgi:hypothetical protein